MAIRIDTFAAFMIAYIVGFFSNSNYLNTSSAKIDIREPPIVSSVTTCTDNHEHCILWAKGGECESNPRFMEVNCALSCGSCSDKKSEKNDRCSRTNATALVKEGDIRRVLENIATSIPSATLLHADPWVVQIDNFLDEEEISTLTHICDERQFTRSLAGDGVNQARTSEQCWCQHAECLSNKVVQDLSTRMSELLESSIKNTEYMQIIRYQKGQFYKLHHDQNAAYNTPCGPRVYTFFLYLTTNDEGGETYFPYINVKVKPVKGRAIIWNSILDSDIKRPDLRTNHEALPTTQDTKLAANYWFHLHDFRTPHKLGCESIFKNTYNPYKYP